MVNYFIYEESRILVPKELDPRGKINYIIENMKVNFTRSHLEVEKKA